MLLIANCGAYGYAMGSHYNRAAPGGGVCDRIMTEVGIIGWRGMVGSVLLERMRAERDFELIEPVFFSTSQAGAAAPDIGRKTRPGAGRERSRRAGAPAHADQHPGRRLHASRARRAARGGLAGLLDRCRLDAAHGAIRR